MARIARVVAAGLPHHITQRGNRRMPTFFCDEDYEMYIDLMAEWCAKWGVEVWAYCLMPNHVHLIAVPTTAAGLPRALGEAHRRYTRMINFREGWRGYLWQGRFASFPLDEAHLYASARYVEQNPVRAGLVGRPEEYPWSSARAHLSGTNDRLVEASRLLTRWPDWELVLSERVEEVDAEALRKHASTGRPLGDEGFLVGLEKELDRRLRPGQPGRPRKKDK
jgi:putative transposase